MNSSISLDQIGVDTSDFTPEEQLDLGIFKNIKSYSLMRMGGAGVEALMARFGLRAFWEYFNLFNPSHDAPYHNKYHSYCMVLNCFEGAYHERLRAPDHNSDLRALLIGGLFHDFDHSAGEYPDEVNIGRAVRGLQLAQKYAGRMGLTEGELKLAESLIRITKYPFEVVPVELTERIIRDSDLMQLYEEREDQLLRQFQGLKQEMELRLGKKFTTQEYADLGDKFTAQVTWYTIWATEKIWIRNWENQRARLRKLLLDADHRPQVLAS